MFLCCWAIHICEVEMFDCRRGLVIILVIGVLSGLFAFGLTFSASSFNSSKLSRNHLIKSKAKLVARSGVEKALQNIISMPMQWRIGPYSSIVEFRQSSNVFASAQVDVRDRSGRLNVNDGIRAGYLELWKNYSPTAMNPYNIYMVPDESAWINLRIRRLLNAFGEVIRREYYDTSLGPFEFLSNDVDDRFFISAYEPKPDVALGDLILSTRPVGGYRSVDSLRDSINSWAVRVGLGLPRGGADWFSEIRDDLTIESYEDESCFRFLTEDRVGTFINYDLQNPEDRSKVHGKDLNGLMPTFEMSFAPHSVAVINLNHASSRVRTATFYAPANVSLPAYTSSSVDRYQESDPRLGSLPNYSHSLLPGIGVGPPVFDPNRLTEEGVGITSGFQYVQKNRLMSLNDARNLSESYGQYTGLTGRWLPSTFEEFREFLKWHHEVYLPDFLGMELERASNDAEGFNDAYDSGEFQQDYLELILPHIFSGIRRLPRWLGAPQSLLSPLYRPVQPDTRPLKASTRGWWSAEDVCIRSTHPKLIFLPSGGYTIKSLGSLNDSPEVTALITSDCDLFQTRVWRSQEQFEQMTQRGAFGTDDDVFVGPEQTSPYGGSVNPSGQFGAVGLLDHPEDPNEEGLGGLTYRLDGQSTDYTDSINPPSDPARDPRIVSPYELNPLFPFFPGLLWNFLQQSQAEVGPNKSIFEGGFTRRALSPFGGYLLNGNTHWTGYNVINSIYWSLSKYPDDDIDIAPLRLTGHQSNNMKEAGERLQTGLAVLWFKMPTTYPYPKTGSSDRAFQCLFNMTVWTPILPVSGMNGVTIFSDYATSDRPVIRPVEIKVGLSWVSEDRTYEIIGRAEQAAAHAFTRTTHGVGFPERSNHALFYNPHKWMTGFQPVFPKNWTQFAAFDDYPVPFVSSLNSNWTSVAQWPFLGIPGLGKSSGGGGSLPPAVKMKHWTADQTRVLERRLRLLPVADNGPGTWHRLAVGWDFNPLKSFSENFWIGLCGPDLEASYTERNDVDYEDKISYTYVPQDAMMSLGTSNVFTVGEAFSRGGEQSVLMSLPLSNWYPAWRANTSIDNLRVKFIDFSKEPGQEIPEWNGRGAKKIDVDPAVRLRMDGEDIRWIMSPGSMLSGDTDMADGKLVSFGVRAYEPVIERPDINWSPKIALNAWEGFPNNAYIISPIGTSPLHGHQIYFDSSDSMPPLKEVSLDVTWKMSDAPTDRNITMAPWVEEVNLVFMPTWAPRFVNWSVD